MQSGKTIEFRILNQDDDNIHGWCAQVIEMECTENGVQLKRTKTLGSGLSVGKALECLNDIVVERYI